MAFYVNQRTPQQPDQSSSSRSMPRKETMGATAFKRATYDDDEDDVKNKMHDLGIATPNTKIADASSFFSKRSSATPKAADPGFATPGPTHRSSKWAGARAAVKWNMAHSQAQAAANVATEPADVPPCLERSLGNWPRPTETPAVDNVGLYMATRLAEVGLTDWFAVPGDYNLVLMDQFLKVPQLRMIRCCNELNAGYAADGYARTNGLGVVMVTFTVGGLSVINAIAGAYSDDVPIICISGGPNCNDFSTNRILHHTLGKPGDFSQQTRCFKEVTCHVEVIQHAEDAMAQIDRAIVAAFTHKKPVYIELCCNLADAGLNSRHTPVDIRPLNFVNEFARSNDVALEAAVERTANVLNAAVKPVLVAGVHIRNCQKEFLELADACGYPVAIMPNAKGMFPEDHPRFMGTYWGQVSSSCCCEIVESADNYLFVGPLFNDYTTTGYSLLVKPAKMVLVGDRRVKICDQAEYGGVDMADFLLALKEKIAFNEFAFTNYHRMAHGHAELARGPGSGPVIALNPRHQLMQRNSSMPEWKAPNNAILTTRTTFEQIQSMLTPKNALCVETGDAWFHCQKLKLPRGCGYEFQMQYGSIGWSVGAALGMQAAHGRKKRVIGVIGDGSFQMTAQEVSTMIEQDYNPIIFLLNNKGYTIEVEIHDGPYNDTKNWDYAGLVQVFACGEGRAYSKRVTTEVELAEAIATSLGERHDSLCFIEVMLDRDDCSKELLEWGARVASANGRPPVTH